MVERGTGPTGSPWSAAQPRVGHGRIGNVRSVLRPAMRATRIPCSFANGSTRTSIFNAGWRVFRQRGSKGRGINPRPAAKFAVGLRTKVAGASARRQPPSSEGVADRLFVGRNAGSLETSPSSVRNPDVGIRTRIIVGPHLRQSPEVNTSPVTDFPMRLYAVVWRPTVRVEFPGFESVDDSLFLDANAGVQQAAVRPHGKPVWK